MVYNLRGNDAARRFTFGGRNRVPLWTPDGRRITFQSDREGTVSIFWQQADGGSVERLFEDAANTQYVPEAWTPDGKALSFWSATPGGTGHVSILRVGATEPPNHLEDTGPRRVSTFSPGGRWIAYASNTATRGLNIFVEPFPPAGTKYQVSFDGGREPVWSPDGKRLYYHQTTQNHLAFVEIIKTDSTFSFRNPVTLPIEGVVFGGMADNLGRNFDISPDGQQFIVVLPASLNSVDPSQLSRQEIDVIINWFEELKARVPTK